jgi:site-specific DNA recombinase
LKAALEALQPGMVLVVDRNDRLARDMLVALTIHKTVEEKGCTIEFADGSPMRTTPEGKLFQNILSAFANFEREKFAERTKKGMQKKKDNGTHCGRPPYGWKIEPAAKVLIKDADEQVRIQSIRAQYQLGFSSDYVAALFNDSHLTCRGKPWSARTIRQIISRNSP